MRMIFWSLLFPLVFIVSSTSADYKNYTFQVLTNIDRSNMLADTVSLKLEPSSITLTYDSAINTFADKRVKLMIESDLYLYDSQLEVTGYQLFLINSGSSCYSSLRPESENKLSGYDNIANIYIDDKVEPMLIGESTTYSEAKFSSDNSVITHDLMLKFKAIGDEDVRHCHGSFVMGFRYDL